MTDLEITKLCAEAMGIAWDKGCPNIMCAECDEYAIPYDPLHDDAQAMALMKKFPGACLDEFDLYVIMRGMDAPMDLNRAICECVAKMQKDKP